MTTTFTLTWKRQTDGSYTAGAYTLRKEAAPGTPWGMWYVYVEGQERHLSRKHLLVDAKSAAAQDVTRRSKEV